MHKEELQNLIFSLSSISMIDSRRMSGACSTHKRERERERDAHRLGKPKRKRKY